MPQKAVLKCPSCQGKLLAHVAPAGDQFPQVPFCRAVLQPLVSLCAHASSIALSQLQMLAFVLVEFLQPENNHPDTGTCTHCATWMGAHEAAHNMSGTSPAWQGSAPPSSPAQGGPGRRDGEPCSSAKNRLPLPAPPAPALLLGTFHCLCLPSCGRGTHWPLSGESSPAGSASARDGQDSDSTQGGKCSCGRDQSCSPPARWAQSCTKLAQRGAGLS